MIRSMLILLAAAVLVFVFAVAEKHKPGPKLTPTMQTQSLVFKSSTFDDGKRMPSKYTCDGENVNPPFAIGGVAAEAKSLILIMDDPDAPFGTWDHWITFNLPPQTRTIEEGKEPEGISGKGTAGNTTYSGPCPPSGIHRYFFKLYALDTVLSLKEGSTKKEVEQAMEGHVLQKATLIGLYARSATQP
jgi:hypothetical protein